MTKCKSKFSDRQRFNWGFWDGYQDSVKFGRDRRDIAPGEPFCLPAFDQIYTAGYCKGQDYAKAGWVGTTSESAWNEFGNQGSNIN
jgi:hypothetical protein